MNAQDRPGFFYGKPMPPKDAAVDYIRRLAGWDGTGEPPIVVIMGDGSLTEAKRVPLWSDGLLYRLVSPEAEQDARALEALGPELLAHIDNMEAE